MDKHLLVALNEASKVVGEEKLFTMLMYFLRQDGPANHDDINTINIDYREVKGEVKNAF